MQVPSTSRKDKSAHPRSDSDGAPPMGDAEAPRAVQRVEQLLALNRAAIAITSELELDALLQRIVDVARELIGSKYAALGVLGEDGYIARFPTSGISDSEREQIGVPPRGHGLLGVMLRAGQTLRVPDISKDPRRVGFPPHHPVMKSLLGVPIFVRDRLVGDLYLTEKVGNHDFSEEDEWLVQLLATHAATALTNAQLHSQNVQALRSLGQLQEAVQQIASHLDLHPLSEELLRLASDLTGSDLAWLAFLDADGHHLTPVASSGTGKHTVFEPGFEVDLDDPDVSSGPVGRAMKSLTPQRLSDISPADNIAPCVRLAERFSLRSTVAVPLLYQGRAIGALNLYARRAHAFDDIDLALLNVLAGHAAVALQNARNYQQVSRERLRSQALLQVSQIINRSVQIDEVIPLIVQSTVNLLGAAGAAVYLAEDAESGPITLEDGSDEKVIVVRYAIGLETPDPATVLHLPLDRSIAGRAIKSQMTQIVPDTAELPDVTLPQLSGGRPLSSMVVIPLRIADRIFGVLSVYGDKPRQFDSESVELMEAFGAQASAAIYNASLYEEARRGREAAEREQERLRELEHMKDEFLSTAAHELRTPLTTIRMSAGLALEQMKLIGADRGADGEGEIDPRVLELIGLVVEGSERMHSLVNDLLDLTRLEQGRTTLNMENMDIREVVRDSVNVTRPLFDSRGQTLTLHLPEAYCYVRGDRPRLEQVIINLLSNANKYSPPGTQIEVRAIRTSEDIMVAVRDSGPGVPAEERERIFERFYRSTLHRNDRTASTGLGLPIARKIAEMHRGRLWVESAPGGGSIFTLSLPVSG